MGKVSADKIRKDLLSKLPTSSEAPIRKVITFTNDDVPRFLQQLDAFEKHSKAARVKVK